MQKGHRLINSQVRHIFYPVHLHLFYRPIHLAQIRMIRQLDIDLDGIPTPVGLDFRHPRVYVLEELPRGDERKMVEGTVIRQVLVYTRHPYAGRIVDADGFVQCRLIAKQRSGRRSRDQYRSRVLQSSSRTLQHGEGQYLRSLFLHKFSLLRKFLVPRGQDMIPRPLRQRHAPEIAPIIVPQDSRHRYGHGIARTYFPIHRGGLHHTRHLVIMLIVFFIGAFIHDPKPRQQRYGDADGETRDIDKGMNRRLEKIAPRGFEDIL